MSIILFQPVTFYVSSLCSWPSSVSTKCPTARPVWSPAEFFISFYLIVSRYFCAAKLRVLTIALCCKTEIPPPCQNPEVPCSRALLKFCTLTNKGRERSFLKIFRLGEIKDVLLFFRGCLAAAAAAAPVFSHLLTPSCAAVRSAGCDQQTTVCRARTVPLKKKSK